MKKLAFVLLALSTQNAFAHAGKTDAIGCHTEKATGIYHCHNSTPEPVEPENAYTFNIFAENNDVLQLQYEGFTLWIDCNRKGATKFRYNAQHDTGNLPRVEKFSLDNNVPLDCQQSKSTIYRKGYDRGHLVPANHLDYSANAIEESNYMTNILPQAANMNRGAWLATEEIVECYRDESELLVIGGVIYGNNKKDDYFIKSHGVETPDSFWKVIIKSDGNAIAWNVPNKSTSIRAKLNSYLVTIAQIEKLTGESIPVAAKVKTQKLTKSWILPTSCKKG